MTATTRKEEYHTQRLMRAPSFLVVRNVVYFTIGGFDGRLRVGEEQRWGKHGLFRAEYIGTDYAILHHQTLWGEVKKIFIPPQLRLTVTNGIWRTMKVNYQSFLNSPDFQ